MKNIVTFDEKLAQRFAPKAKVLAFLREGPGEYNVSWGNGLQKMDEPHFVMIKLGDDGRPFAGGAPYGCERGVFETTYERVADSVYRKIAFIDAHRAPAAGTLTTRLNGKDEVITEVREGQWLVRNPKGEVYAVSSDAEFDLSYELAPAGP